MNIKTIIEDWVIPGVVCVAASCAKLIEPLFLQIAKPLNTHFDWIVDEVIHVGTALSVLLGCVYLIIKIIFHKKHSED